MGSRFIVGSLNSDFAVAAIPWSFEERQDAVSPPSTTIVCRPSIRCGPVVPTTMAKREDVKTNADLQGVLTRELKCPASFGGQRSIQLSYGRLSASIDETPASGNGPDFARFGCGGGSCGKVRVFESSRARQLPCAEGMPGVRLNLPFV
jgi:hypothetical protein